MMKKHKTKNLLQKRTGGITLIALVVTIIILLILAGISISMLTGNNRNNTQCNNGERANRDCSRKRTIRNGNNNNKD